MACLLNTPEAIAAYHEAGEKLALLEQLTEWREAAGLTKAQVAARMGVTPPAITRLERNVTRASWLTLNVTPRLAGWISGSPRAAKARQAKRV